MSIHNIPIGDIMSKLNQISEIEIMKRIQDVLSNGDFRFLREGRINNNGSIFVTRDKDADLVNNKVYLIILDEKIESDEDTPRGPTKKRKAKRKGVEEDMDL